MDRDTHAQTDRERRTDGLGQGETDRQRCWQERGVRKMEKAEERQVKGRERWGETEKQEEIKKGGNPGGEENERERERKRERLRLTGGYKPQTGI